MEKVFVIGFNNIKYVAVLFRTPLTTTVSCHSTLIIRTYTQKMLLITIINFKFNNNTI